MDVDTARDFTLSAPRVAFDFSAHAGVLWRGYDVFPDGESVLGVRHVRDEEPKDENAMPAGIHVVQNWLAEFRD